jgi:hypothetical protein
MYLELSNCRRRLLALGYVFDSGVYWHQQVLKIFLLDGFVKERDGQIGYDDAIWWSIP